MKIKEQVGRLTAIKKKKNDSLYFIAPTIREIINTKNVREKSITTIKYVFAKAYVLSSTGFVKIIFFSVMSNINHEKSDIIVETTKKSKITMFSEILTNIVLLIKRNTAGIKPMKN
ncbi:hypothetical protein [Caldicellulosiruptor naganoensis]|uniref:Uncharacterized protein n=1 Tax=Caldicellulosiruptor naganoensis TaxID=29324 RepID=A0ABY7BFY8_9FIRM|nr:hypothetical protein [Caldicellulosiruptor naganoensis]WAM31735.1 hypothetical protein OTJ99_000184 [Caldicellulosiruptor naganoensis]